ncbi:MAG: carboxypeptidase-like regulatory domain-containing protein, partial [Planctomycetota bacterium]|nr:carboxypeptidase-like regulatory domain-containing protein [Planctomycetota bacterium]
MHFSLHALIVLCAFVLQLPMAHGTQEDTTSEFYVITVVDDQGSPIANEPINLYASESWNGGGYSTGIAYPLGQTDPGGKIYLRPRENWGKGGVLNIQFKDPALTGKHRSELELPWDGKAGENRLILGRVGWIKGRILSYDPCPPVWIDEHASFNGLNPFVVDSKGIFLYGPVAPGEHTLQLRCMRFSGDFSFAVEPGETTKDLIFDMNQGGWIEGFALDADGSPMTQARVYTSMGVQQMFEDNGTPWIHPDTGAFLIGPLSPGPSPILMVGRERNIPLVQEWVEVPKRGAVKVSLKADKPTITLGGSVTVAGAPAAGVYVRVWHLNSLEDDSCRTDVHGRWALPLPLPGDYQVMIQGIALPPRHLKADTTLDAFELPDNQLEFETPDFGDPNKTWWFDVVGLDPSSRRDSRSMASTERNDPICRNLRPGSYWASA